jgi:uncharacterized OB-fold protein
VSAIHNFSVPELADLHPDTWTGPFWSAARDHRLVVPRCTTCGFFRMPPGPYCAACRSQSIEWTTVTGRGTVFAFTIVRHAVMPSVASQTPYVIAVVELDEAPGVRLVTNLWDSDDDDVAIGLKVQVLWDDVAENVTIPRFAPAKDGRP